MARPRHCARPACGEPASASLSYRYASGTAWLDDLTGEAGPTAWDLCAHHADGLRLPRGWTFEDRRSAAPSELPRPLAG